MNVVRRVDGSGGRRFGLRDRRLIDRGTIENPFDRIEAQRPVGDTDNADMSVVRFAIVFVIEKSRRRHGEVAAPPGKFLETQNGVQAAKRVDE